MQFDDNFKFVFDDDKIKKIYFLIQKLNDKIIEKIFFNFNDYIINVERIKDFN